jgi:broad specificity phosphatase PhoE
MVSELQSLVDNLGARLRRSVAIDDRNLRLLAYSSHHGDVDPLRLHSLMQREAPKELVDYLYSLGGFAAEDLFVQPVKPELGLTIERMVMPIRYGGSLLGFMWLLRSDGPLDADQHAVVRIAAERAGRLLSRDHVIDQSRQASIKVHLRNLLGDDSGARVQAMERLIEEDMLVAGPVTVLVVTLPREAEQPLGERDRAALGIGAEQACRRVPPGGASHLERSDHGVIVVAHSGALDQDVDDLAVAVRQRVCAETGRPATDCYVGIGEKHPSLSDAHNSNIEARQAADVGRAIRVLGAVVRHSHLGVYSLLADMPPDGLRRSIHPGLRRLLDYDADHGVLAGTLEAFFDNATDVTRTAAKLNIHRASLHYRLRRIQEITGLDLSAGDDRLSLHLGLKVTRLIGLR